MYYRSGTANTIACEEPTEVDAYAAVKRCSSHQVDDAWAFNI